MPQGVLEYSVLVHFSVFIIIKWFQLQPLSYVVFFVFLGVTVVCVDIMTFNSYIILIIALGLAVLRFSRPPRLNKCGHPDS
jgi:DMSO/TMAO reductase YedYZ heme-binding membrane subunit